MEKVGLCKSCARLNCAGETKEGMIDCEAYTPPRCTFCIWYDHMKHFCKYKNEPKPFKDFACKFFENGLSEINGHIC